MKNPAVNLISSLCVVCFPLLISANPISGPFEVQESVLDAGDGIVRVQDKVEVGRKTLGTDADLSYIITGEDAVTALTTATHFGGYYSQHQFLWEVNGESTAQLLMLLDYDGLLELYSGGSASSDYISFDAKLSEITLNATGGTVILGNNAGVLEVNGNPVLSTNSNGSVTIGNVPAHPTDTSSGNLFVENTLYFYESGNPNHENTAYASISAEHTHLSPRLDLGNMSGIQVGTDIGIGIPANPSQAVYTTPGLFGPTDLSKDLAIYTRDDAYGTNGNYQERLVFTSGSDPKATFHNIDNFMIDTGALDTVAMWVVKDGASPDPEQAGGSRVGINLDASIHPNGPVHPFHVSGTAYFEHKVAINDRMRAGYGSHNHHAVGASAIGPYAQATSYNSIILGAANAPTAGQSSSAWVGTDELFVVGNGYDGNNGGTENGTIESGERSNALVITKDGNADFSAEVTVAGKATFADEVTIARIPAQGDISMGLFQ